MGATFFLNPKREKLSIPILFTAGVVGIGKTLSILKLICDDNGVQLYIDLTKFNSNFKDNIERLFKKSLFIKNYLK